LHICQEFEKNDYEPSSSTTERKKKKKSYFSIWCEK